MLAEAANVSHNHILNYVAQCDTKAALIGDFQKRPAAVGEVDKRIGEYNKKQTAVNAVNCNNKYFITWLATILMAVWYVVGGIRVLTGDDELGVFITNLAIFKSVGDSWGVIFGISLRMQAALPHLLKIVTFMNLASDVPKRRELGRRRRKAGEEQRQKAR